MLLKEEKESLLTSGSSGKMLSTSLLYRGLSAPQQPQTPEEGEKWRGKKTDRSGQLGLCSMTDRNTIYLVSFFLFPLLVIALVCTLSAKVMG